MFLIFQIQKQFDWFFEFEMSFERPIQKVLKKPTQSATRDYRIIIVI